MVVFGKLGKEVFDEWVCGHKTYVTGYVRVSDIEFSFLLKSNHKTGKN